MIAATYSFSFFTHGYVIADGSSACAASGSIFGGSVPRRRSRSPRRRTSGGLRWSSGCSTHGVAVLRWTAAVGVAGNGARRPPAIAVWGLSWRSFALSVRSERTAKAIRGVSRHASRSDALSGSKPSPTAEIASQSYSPAMTYGGVACLLHQFRPHLDWVTVAGTTARGAVVSEYAWRSPRRWAPSGSSAGTRACLHHECAALCVCFWAAELVGTALLPGYDLHAFAPPPPCSDLSNKFRILLRHLLLFAFAIAVLAGADWPAHGVERRSLRQRAARSVSRCSSLAVAARSG